MPVREIHSPFRFLLPLARLWARARSRFLPARERILFLLSRGDGAAAERALLASPELASLPTPSGSEGLLDCAIRHSLEPFCLLALRLGADPFEPPWPRDDQGRRCRLRPFEAAICRDFGEFLLACQDALGRGEILRHRRAWSSYEADAHPIALPWRFGSDWFHLAGAAGAPRAARALRRMGLLADRIDSSGATPLLACAARGGGEECAAELLLAGADLYRQDSMGTSPSDFVGTAWEGAAARFEALSIAARIPSAPAASAPARSL